MQNLVMIFFTSLGIGLTGAVMPGPMLAVTLKESLSRGKWAAFWLATGHSFLELLMVGALAGGMSRLIATDAVTGPVGFLGGAVLVWMGVGAFKQTRHSESLGNESGPRRRAHNLLVGGAAVTIANPYWMAWWLTAGLALLVISTKAGAAGIVTFYVGHISADFLWYGFVGLLVGSGRRMLEARVYRIMLQVCGVFLLVFGLLFVGYGGRMIQSVFLR